jgi:hypothetical protein
MIQLLCLLTASHINHGYKSRIWWENFAVTVWKISVAFIFLRGTLQIFSDHNCLKILSQNYLVMCKSCKTTKSCVRNHQLGFSKSSPRELHGNLLEMSTEIQVFMQANTLQQRIMFLFTHSKCYWIMIEHLMQRCWYELLSSPKSYFNLASSNN